MWSEFFLPGTPPGLFWGLVAVAVLIQGISKSGFAGGAGILSLPLMMFVMPADKVTATLLLVLNFCDFNAIYHRTETHPAGTGTQWLVWTWLAAHGCIACTQYAVTVLPTQ